jgi:hypothetical protein
VIETGLLVVVVDVAVDVAVVVAVVIVLGLVLVLQPSVQVRLSSTNWLSLQQVCVVTVGQVTEHV